MTGDHQTSPVDRSNRPKRNENREASSDSAVAISSETACPECGARARLEKNESDRYCGACGAIVASSPSLERAWSHDHGGSYYVDAASGAGRLGSTIVPSPGAAQTTTRQQARSSRLQLWHTRVALRGTDQTIEYARQEISRICSAVGLGTDARERAGVIYVRAREEGIQYRRSVETVASAAVHLTVRLMGLPCTTATLASVIQVDRTDMTRTATAIKRALGLEIEPRTPDCYLSKYASALDLSLDTEQRARDWIDQSPDALSSRSPANVAAAALYKAAFETRDEQVSQQTVAENTSISRSQLSSICQELCRPEQ